MIQSLAKPTYTNHNSRILGYLWERAHEREMRALRQANDIGARSSVPEDVYRFVAVNQ
jgi:hypothetical protein